VTQSVQKEWKVVKRRKKWVKDVKRPELYTRKHGSEKEKKSISYYHKRGGTWNM